MQEEIIQSVLSGNDTLALMPTGGGKSICFQVPALSMDGLCLVVSPLIALMKDQVESLRKKGITAFAIHTGMSRKEVINILKLSTGSNCKFLYVSPERLETTLFREYLPAMDINLLAIDEAHCISQWGYDFRPPYLRIANIREELPGVPVLALTASATPLVQQDICDKLQFKQPQIFRRSFERPNLSFSVFEEAIKINKILEVLQKVPGCSIVYCKSRRRTKEISDLLNLHGIAADYYHAGLEQEIRNNKQSAWLQNRIRTIVCTNAFGMGIDKPDVRTVVHADVPDCLENYYQEAGRAGRDGQKAYAVLLYNTKDLQELEALPDIRFPSEKDLQQLYEAVMNYLQIPSGSGEGNYYDFDIGDCIKKFKLDGQLMVHGLKALEQEGFLAFSEQLFLPARAGFVTGKDMLYDFENQYPDLEPLIKVLLRNYEGIFDHIVPIHEKTIARLLQEDAAIVIRQLNQLQAYGILAYLPQKDTPQIYLPKNRALLNELHIKKEDYQKRKQLFTERIQTILAYTNERTQCRSQFIAAYFGDVSVQPCGICDNCLHREKSKLSDQDFENIEQQFRNTLRSRPVAVRELMQSFTGIRKEKAWKVFEFMQSENKIAVDKEGQVYIV